MGRDAGQGKRRPSVRLVALAIAVGWGPALVVALIVYFTTHRVPYALLTFAIVTAISAIVYGAVGAMLMAKKANHP